MTHSPELTKGSIVEVIQGIIDLAKDARFYQPECETIVERLKRLKKKLQGPNDQLRREIGAVKFEKTFKSLMHTLSTTRRLIQECQNPNTLKGKKQVIATRTLERELDKMKYVLTSYEADLTADRQAKKEILASTLNEKQSADRNRQYAKTGEEARVILELIELETKTEAKENLKNLYEKYKGIVDRYIEASQCVLTGIPVIGLETSVDNFITGVYKIEQSEPPKDKEENKSKLQETKLPLSSVYIHLQANHSTTFEREQARKLIFKDEERAEGRKDEYDRDAWMRLAFAPGTDSLNERSTIATKPENEEKFSFQTILQNNRWIVILGDPGSGKTTFVRWLTSRYIEAIMKKEETVSGDMNNNNQEDDTQTNEGDNTNSIIIGTTRMPILIRVGEFVDTLKIRDEELKRDHKTSDDHSSMQHLVELSLFDYIGDHTWMGNPMLNFADNAKKEVREKASQELRTALQDYIEKGYALIVLDGLDEISDIDTRKRVVGLVEEFTDKYVKTPTSISVFDARYSGGELDIPSKTGGNQLVITSRIVGYHAQPLSGEFSHYTILPMKEPDMIMFADQWFRTVHQQMIKTLKLEISDDKMTNVCTQHAAGLKNEIKRTENDGLRRMASNPCLLNFICYISFQKPDAKLPVQRILLYEKLASSMLKLWAGRDLSGFLSNSMKIDRLLCDIAIYIHQNSSSGLIETTDLKRVCYKSIEPITDLQTQEEREETVNNCVQQFQDHSGILTARGQNLFGFLHLTLQEYYTCRGIVSTLGEGDRPQKLVEVFQKYITDPRFYVPLTLVLSLISLKWKESDVREFFGKLLSSNNDLSKYFPLEIFMFITSITELKNKPSDEQMFTAFTRLLTASAQNRWHTDYPNLEKRMATSLLKLSPDLVKKWIMEVLESPESTIESITALCTLLQECDRITRSTQDEKNKITLDDWTNQEVCERLSKYLRKDSIDNQFIIDVVLAKVAVSNFTILPSNDLQKFLKENPSYLNKLSLPFVAAIIALFGGLMVTNKERKGTKYTGYTPDGKMVTSVHFAVVFSSERMHRKSPLASFLIELIRAEVKNKGGSSRKYAVDHILQRIEQISSEDRSLKAIDTFILMFCIVGVDEAWLYKPFIGHVAFHQAIARFKRICHYLRQFYFVPEIYDKYRSSISSKQSLLSNYNSFNEYTYNQYTVNRDSTQLIELFMSCYQSMQKVDLKVSSTDVQNLLTLIESISRARARLCTSTRTSLTNKWICKTDQRLLLLPKFFQKQENLEHLLAHPSSESAPGDLSFPTYVRALWLFDDYRHGADMSETMIEKGERSMILAYDRNHSYALAFVQKHLQLLLSRAISKGHISMKTQSKSQPAAETLSFAHILCQSLISVCNNPVPFSCQSALITLLPLCRLYGLESLVLALLWWTTTQCDHDPGAIKWYFEEMQRSTDDSHFSYTDNSRQLTTVERAEISDEDATNGYRHVFDKGNDRLHDALELLKSKKSEKQGNTEVFSASVCLGYLCWFLPAEQTVNQFTEVIDAASKITDPMIRLDALIILASCPVLKFRSNTFDNLSAVRTTISKRLEETFAELQSDLTPLLSVPLVCQYIAVMGANDQSVERIRHIIKQTNRLKNDDDKRAICIALGPYVSLSADLPARLCQLLQQFAPSAVLDRAQVLQFDSPALRYFVEGTMPQKGNNLPFLNNHDYAESMPVLYACLYLSNLAGDLQRLPGWLADDQPMKLDLVASLHHQIDHSQQKRMLTYSHVMAIEKRIELSMASEELLSLEKELTEFEQCERSARSFVMKWLKYKSDPSRSFLAYHGALILATSGFWAKRIAIILCDLLQNENDRFRQRAECLLREKERKSTEVGWDVLLIFMEKFIEYETLSSHVSFVLSRFFENVTIDDTEHLDELIDWENQRLSVNSKQKKKETPTSPEEQHNILENSSPIARWFIKFTPRVMKYFVDYLQSFIKDFERKMKSGQKLRSVRRQFIFGWCGRILTADSKNTADVLKVLSTILTGTFASEIRCSAAFAIGRSETDQAQEILHNVIVSRSQSRTTIPDSVVAMCLHAYCYSCSLTKAKAKKTADEKKEDDEEGEKPKKTEKHDNSGDKEQVLCRKMSKGPSEVCEAARIELAKVCSDVEKLLESCGDDADPCYKALITVDIDQSFTDGWNQYSKCLTNLIKRHPELLKMFIVDLHESTNHFCENVERYPDWSEDIDGSSLVSLASDLAEGLPIPFYNEIEQSNTDDTETSTRFWLNTSRQHDYFRRNACIKLLSTVGTLMKEICQVLIDGVAENSLIQTSCYEAIKQFRKPRALPLFEKTLQQLDRTVDELKPAGKQSKVSVDQLVEVLNDLKRALIDLRSTKKYLKQSFEQIQTVLKQLKSEQKQLKNILEELQEVLEKLKPSLEQWDPAVKWTIRQLESSSMNKRWAAALFLERLVQCNMISAQYVQNLLIETIEDPTSDAELWLAQNNDAQSLYKCVGSLKHVICKLLMRMTLIDERSSEADVIQAKNRLLEDFAAAETNAKLAKCVNVDEDLSDNEEFT